MPFCPKCHAEYIDEEKICPDCNVQLVPVLDKPQEAHGTFGFLKGILGRRSIRKADRENWTELEYIYDEISGVMIKGILENSGIRVVIEDAHFSNPYKMDIKSSINYRGVILVHKEDFDKARKLISEYLKAINENDNQ
mgnify:CR=1 FL=1